jgi:hypothetical protein
MMNSISFVIVPDGQKMLKHCRVTGRIAFSVNLLNRLELQRGVCVPDIGGRPMGRAK